MIWMVVRALLVHLDSNLGYEGGIVMYETLLLAQRSLCEQ